MTGRTSAPQPNGPHRSLRLEVRHLQLVASIVEEGSLTRAGQRLHLTQSALSHQLLDLEERLGTPLFHRINKKMSLTEAGTRVLASARQILESLAQTEDDLDLYASNQRGAIRLTTECYTVYHWLPTVMKQFESVYPDVQIKINVDATRRPLNALIDGTLDLAFVTSDRASAGVVTEPLFSDETRVIVHPGHRFASQAYVKPAELVEETLLTYSTLEGNLVYERILRPAGLTPRKHLQMQLTEAIIELVKARVGVGLMARWAVAGYVASGAVAAVPLTRQGVKREWKAAHLSARPMQPYVRAFIDMVATEGPRALEMTLPFAAPKQRAVSKRA
ncbi:MAG: LysR family transcriptional regulator [Acidobacteriota bacterium]